MLRQACLVLLVYSIGRSESSSILERWVSASLNYEVLKAGSITRVNRPARTMGKCLMWATLLGSEGNTGSASLACYEEGTCTIWPIQAMAVIIKDPSIEDPVCKAIERCMANDGSILDIGDMDIDPGCPMTYSNICTKSGLIPTSAPFPTAATCPLPYTWENGLCTYDFSSNIQDWCGAKSKCQTIGGDLASPNTPAELSNLGLVLDGISSSSKFYIGLHNGLGAWKWASHDRPVEAVEWKSGYPTQPGTACAGIRATLLVEDDDCSSPQMYICEIKIV